VARPGVARFGFRALHLQPPPIPLTTLPLPAQFGQGAPPMRPFPSHCGQMFSPVLGVPGAAFVTRMKRPTGIGLLHLRGRVCRGNLLSVFSGHCCLLASTINAGTATWLLRRDR
jgi:hypothetical protein